MLSANSRLASKESNIKKKDSISKSKISKKEPRMFNCIVSQSRLKKSSKASIRRKTRKIKRDLKTKSSSLKKMLKRGSKLSMIPNSS